MASDGWKGRARGFLREPVIRFFIAGALLFVAHRAFVGAPRTVTVTPGLRAELSRRFEDANGRKPSPQELGAEVDRWKRDEALFREAVREHLDRDDAGIRTILVDKMRLRAGLEVPGREPTAAELDAWLAGHRSLYEAPPRYDFELVTIPKDEPGARSHIDEIERALAAGKSPANLGRPLLGGNLTAEDLKSRLEPELAARLPQLPAGAWQRLDTGRSLVVARLKGVAGGLPGRDELGARLIADWKLATQKEAVERVLQRTIDRYRFEERP